MPRVILLFVVLAAIALAIRQVLAAMAAGPYERELRGAPTDGDDPPPDEDGPEGWAWLHRRLTDAYAVEREGWALEQVRRVAGRLQAGRPEGERFRVEIRWIPEVTAFTTPGRSIYLSRRLLERAPGDEAVALAVAHEIAHHDLGHLAAAGGWLEALPAPVLEAAGDLAFLFQRRLLGPEREAEADAHGLNLCLAAGYDAYRCVRLFDVLSADALDHGDAEAVFGSGAAVDAALDRKPGWYVELLRWRYERRRGYPSIRDRKAALVSAYEAALSARRREAG
jgi:Zn-dependent protease with chaperone function